MLGVVLFSLREGGKRVNCSQYCHSSFFMAAVSFDKIVATVCLLVLAVNLVVFIFIFDELSYLVKEF